MLPISALILASVALVQLVGSAGAFFNCGGGSTSLGCYNEMRKYYKHYDGINQYLERNLSASDPTSIQRALEAWIKRESSRKLTGDDVMRLKALIQLHNLALTEGPGRCTPSSARIMQANDLALKGAISKLEPYQTPASRIEKFVNYYVRMFLLRCDFESALKDFEPDKLIAIRRIVGEFVGTRARDESIYMLFNPRAVSNASTFVEQQPTIARSFAKTMKGIRPKADAAAIYNSISKLAEENLDVESMSILEKSRTSQGHADANRQVFKKYLFEPCEEYVSRVESSFGSSWALIQSTKWHKKRGTEAELNKKLTYYYGCQIILNHEEDLLARLETKATERQ